MLIVKRRNTGMQLQQANWRFRQVEDKFSYYKIWITFVNFTLNSTMEKVERKQTFLFEIIYLIKV